MKILLEKPPAWIWQAAGGLVDLTGRQPLFCYGDAIYNPMNGGVDDHILAHEAVHAKDQEYWSGGPDGWWTDWLDRPDVRLSQELPAYRTQYQSFCAENADRNKRNDYAIMLARDLASPMYGGIITAADALARIRRP